MNTYPLIHYALISRFKSEKAALVPSSWRGSPLTEPKVLRVAIRDRTHLVKAAFFLKLLLIGSPASETKTVAIRFLPVYWELKDNKHCFCSYQRDRLLGERFTWLCRHQDCASSGGVSAHGVKQFFFLALCRRLRQLQQQQQQQFLLPCRASRMPGSLLMITTSEREGYKSSQLKQPRLKGGWLPLEP